MSLDVTTQFAIWAPQYYIMAGGTMTDSIRDWWAGGAITGAIIAYKKGMLDYFTMGPMAGYVSGATGLDKVYWGIEPDVEPLAETSSSESGSAT